MHQQSKNVWCAHLRNAKKRINKQKKAAFTLAEVLITLGIIGIVAAMTLPTLISGYQKKQTVTQLKKAYSEINQAILISQAKYGTLDQWDFSDLATQEEQTTYFGEHYLLPNIKTLRVCTPTSEECWAKTYTLDGQERNIHSSNRKNPDNSFIAASGYSVYYWVHAVGNGGWIVIDTNGPKKPNIIGKDVFPFVMSWGNSNQNSSTKRDTCQGYKLGLYPYNLACKVMPTRDELINGGTTVSNCKKGTNSVLAGYACSALIMYDNWEISKDYPW